MQVRLATYADRDLWDDYVMSHPDGTGYHLFSWKEAVETAYAFNGVYIMAEEDGRLLGVLPLVDFRIPLVGRTLISLPYCDAGGVLADEQALDALLQYARSQAFEMRSNVKIRSNRALLSCGQNLTDKVSMLLELPENSKNLLASLSSKVRSQAQKPIRDGLTSKIGRNDLIDAFYKIFAENMRDLGSPVHSRLWFQSIMSASGDSARIVVVYSPDKKPVAAGLILLHPARVSIPWASSLRYYNHMNPNMLLYWTCLAFAADNGYQTFDFGRSTPNEGTYRFKKQWGAQPSSLYWYTLPPETSNSKFKASGRPSSRRQLAANLWQKIPQSGTDWLGPKVRKYISL